MSRLAPWSQFASVFVVLLCASFVILARDRTSTELPPHLLLSQFPVELGEWRGVRDIALPSDVLATLGPGQFLLRDYRAQGSLTNLFIFYPSESKNNEIHSPKNCLPGAGWSPIRSGRIQIQRIDGSYIQVNRYIVGKGFERVLVLYWYQGHGHITPSEFWAKYFLARDAILDHRTDSALVRIIQPYTDLSGQANAERRAVDFAKQILQVLDSYIPI